MENNGTNGGNKIIDSIVKGGAVAILGALLALTIWINFKTSANHINHGTDALLKNTETLLELKSSIDQTNEIAKTQVKAIEVQSKAIEGLTNAFLRLK